MGYSIPQQSIATIESRGAVRPQCLWELCRALEVEERWLLYGEGPKGRRSGPTTYERDLLFEVVHGVEEALLRQGASHKTSPAVRAELMATLYEYFAQGDEENEDLSRAQVIDLHTKLKRV
ncbi:MAG: hypothetical protein HKN05_14010 [Rhizobiales bacterium]|nr:hypothetical protein [Hyphomicrobiales bacterium]